MNKTLKTILITFSILIVFLIVFVFFALQKENPKEGSIEQRIQNIFPFGNVSNTDNTFPNGENVSENNTEQNNAGTTTESEMIKEIPILRKISDKPTSGSVVLARDIETIVDNKKIKIRKYFVRFVDRATGHIFETPIDSFDVTKISNTTLPKIYEASFDSTGNSFIARFLDEKNTDIIKTYSVFLKDTKTASTSTSTIEYTPKETVGTYLEQDIKEYSLFPSKTKLGYLIYKDGGSSIITTTLNGQNKKQVFSSKLREWLLETESESKITITTKPSGEALGFSYSLNTANGAITKLFGSTLGLTVKPLVGTNKYLIGIGGGELRTYFKNPFDETPLVSLFSTLPEKCVQGRKEIEVVYCAVPRSVPSGTYPDNWYTGEVSFNDNIWQANSKTNKTSFINSPFLSIKENLDGINLQISIDDNYLTFINKKDLSLWGLILKKQTATASTTVKSN